MTRILLVAVVSVLSGSMAHAQPVEGKQPSLKIPTIIFAGAAAADWATTYQARKRGAAEGNPMFSWIDNPGHLVTVGAASDVIGVWAWKRYVGRKHGRLAMVGLYAISAVRIGLAIRNHRVQRIGCHVAVPLAC